MSPLFLLLFLIQTSIACGRRVGRLIGQVADQTVLVIVQTLHGLRMSVQNTISIAAAAVQQVQIGVAFCEAV